MKVNKVIQKQVAYVVNEESIFALRLFSDLLRSIDINVEIVKQEEIILEENKQHEDLFENNMQTVAIKMDGNEKKEVDDYDEDDDADNQLKLKKVYFIENPLITLLNNQKLQEFFVKTDRSSWIAKVSSVLTLFKEVFHEIKFNMNLKDRSWWLYNTLNIDYYKVELPSFLLIFIINLLLLFSQTSENNGLHDHYYTTTIVLGLILLISNLTFFIIYLTSRFRFLVDFELKKLEEAEQVITITKYLQIYKKCLIDNTTSFFFITNIILSAVGIAIPESTFAFTLLLMHFVKFSKAGLVVYAFRMGIVQLIHMIIFLLILVWIYSLIAFYWVNPQYLVKIKNDVEENICASVTQCFVSFFNHGIRNGGGLADMMPKEPFSDTPGYTGRYLIDMLFFILVILLILNMINGIIINTFSQLREEQEVKEADINNNCFICNLTRNTFQKKKIYFDTHANKQHYIRDYLLYLISIKLKPEKDLDPDETRIAEALKLNDVSFFPSRKALDWDWTLVEDEEDNQ